MKGIILSTFVLIFQSVYAQSDKIKIFVGPEISLPVENGNNDHLYGIGAGLDATIKLSKHFHFTGSTAFISYNGNIPYWKNGQYQMSNSFSLIPVILGIKYNIYKFYLGMGAGAVIGAGGQAVSHMALEPFTGYQFNKLNLHIALLGIPQFMATIPEKSTIQKGGYSFLNISISYKIK